MKVSRQYLSVFRYLEAGFTHDDVRQTDSVEVIHLLSALS